MTFLRCALACSTVAWFVALAPGCSGDDTAPPAHDGGTTPTDGGAELTCDTPGVARCGTACVSIDSDPHHCGACDNVCASGACVKGTCEGQCTIDGSSVAEGATNPANACEVCAPSTSASAWSARADGTACGAGQLCHQGACAAGCTIDGAFVAGGAANPANLCQICTPSASTTAWSARGAVPLLIGETDAAAQGWSTAEILPGTTTYGADYTQLSTSTAGATSGQRLLYRANAVDPLSPFKLRVTLLVQAVTTHNPLDSGAAILGSFTPNGGTTTDRSEMIYLDSAAVGWGDDAQSAAFAVTDGNDHVYELAVDAARVATVSVDGVAKLTRNSYQTNGTIAVGDQSNDPNVDGTIRIKSIERVCP